MSSAAFKIETSPFADRGFDASNGQVLSLQLEDTPALDINSCVYVVKGRSKGAPDPVLANGGVASPPTAAVTFTCPGSGSHSYRVRCVTNNGASVPGADGKPDFSVNNKERIISIRTPNAAMRKMIAGEATEYSPTGGWADAQNEMVDQVDAAVTAAAGTTAARGPAKVASTGNVDLSGTVASVDSISLSTGDRALLWLQDNPTQNGLYEKLITGFLQRTADADTAIELPYKMSVPVQQGTYKGRTFILATQAIVVGSTPITFLIEQPELDARYYAKADGTTDDASSLQTVHLVSKSVKYTPGTYYINTNVTLGARDTTHAFVRGAKFYVASGKTLTVDGLIEAAPDQQIFDGPGTVVVANSSSPVIQVGWCGALGTDDAIDDAPGITRAIVIAAASGLDVAFHRPPNGHFAVRSMISIGAFTTATQGVRLLLIGGPYNVANLKCTASLGAGVPMVRMISTFRALFGNASLDANGLADVCVQRVAPVFGPRASALPGWHGRGEQLTMRNARVANEVNGDVCFRATVSGATFTAAGHELANDDEVYFIPILRSAVVPGGFSRDVIYHVVGVSGGTFQLSATEGGGAITATNSGTTGPGGWLICRKDQGDVTASLALGTHYGNITPGVAAYPVAHVINSADNTFETTHIGSTFQGNMQTPQALGRDQFTVDTGANTITSNVVVFDSGSLRAPAVGDVLLLWADDPFSSHVLPGGLSPDTEYWVKTVADNGGGSHTMTLSATQGGSTVDITPGGVGTWTCSALAWPYFGLMHQLGTFNLRNCVTVGLYADVAIRPRPGSTTGFSGTMQLHSESWRVLDGDAGGVTLTNQLGDVALDHVDHSSIWQNSGQASIIWNATLFGGLSIQGGDFTGDLRTVNDPNNAAPVILDGPMFWAPTRQPGVIDPVGTVRGSWESNGVPGSRLVGSTVTIAIQTTSAPVTSDRFRFTIDGSSNNKIVSIGHPIILEAPSASAWELNAPGGGLGIFVADALQFIDAGGTPTLRAQITYPGGIATVASAGWEHITSSSHFAAFGFTYCQLQAPVIHLDADTLNLRDGAGNHYGTITYPSNNVGLTAISDLLLDCGSTKFVSVKANGGEKFRVDENGIRFFGAGAGVAKATIAGALSTVTDAAAKAVLTSIIAAISGYDLATDGTT